MKLGELCGLVSEQFKEGGRMMERINPYALKKSQKIREIEEELLKELNK